MKKKNGFAISAIIYMILVLFLLLLLSTLSILASNKVALDKVKNEVMSEVKDNGNISGNVFSYSYTGGIQSFTVPCNGLYKLEVWGAQGGSSYNGTTGGMGGYSLGYKFLTTSSVLYIAVGGQGTSNGSHTTQAGGYNGGGTASADGDGNTIPASGGGATSITSTNRGILVNYSSYQNEILIIAGGGGGGARNAAVSSFPVGGSGGGTTGGNGGNYYESSNVSGTGYGGSQTTGGGYSGTLSSGYYAAGSFGVGASTYTVGGGGGFYGGGAELYSSGGGSGYIGGVPSITYNGTTYSPSTINGAQSGTGVAKITFISY